MPYGPGWDLVPELDRSRVPANRLKALARHAAIDLPDV
jgi:hypothetical protein